MRNLNRNHLLLILTALVLCVALVNARTRFIKTQPSASTSPTPQAVASIAWQKIIQPNAMFSSEIFLQRNNTFLSIPIKFEHGTQVAWLSLDSTSSARLNRWLVTHPVMDRLLWPVVNEGQLHLYQRNPIYATVAGFLDNPPDPKTVAIDPAISDVSEFKKIKGTPLTENIDLTAIDYILTTYVPPERARRNSLFRKHC